MFVSPSQALSLKATGAPARSAEPVVSSGDSAPSAGKPTPEPLAFTHSVSDVEYDSDARRLVVRQIHESSGTLLSQYPNEAQLRIREYVADAEAARGQFFTETV